ncbi:hypothetical protein [Pseudolactococcus laudensis]|uniref:hypothetical protein n=1 Tax=Pseudolactococcus laudensis TaxID=1494461 RepID=UPI003F95A750
MQVHTGSEKGGDGISFGFNPIGNDDVGHWGNSFMRKTEDEAGQIIDTANATAQQIISDAQAEITEKEAQSREELDRLKGRIDHYSTQINAAAQTIDTLLGTISSL